MRTQRNIVVALYRDFLSLLDLIDALEDCQTVTDTVDAHLLQIIMQQGNQSLAYNLVF